MRRVTRGGAPTGRLSCFVSHVNGDLIAQASIDAKKGYVDATHPQVVIFEPETSGAPHLIGADYIILAADWNNVNCEPFNGDGN